MDGSEQRHALAGLIAASGASLAALSRLLDRNPAWLQQYLRRGTPKLLPERDRGRLARFFGIDEAVLGGMAAAVVTVPRLDVAASAGPGRRADGEPRSEAIGYDPAELAALGVAAGDASEIAVAGDSMAPTLHDGDRILVDRGQRAPAARDAIWVLRVGDELWVKRLVRDGREWRIVSDADGWPEERRAVADVEVVGRVVRLVRAL